LRRAAGRARRRGMTAITAFWLLCLGLFLNLAADAPTLDDD
jgi:hypothetical protein